MGPLCQENILFTQTNSNLKLHWKLSREIRRSQLCQEFGLAAKQIYNWKKKLEKIGPEVFADKRKQQDDEHNTERLHATIGRLKVENDFLSKALGR